LSLRCQPPVERICSRFALVDNLRRTM